MQTIYKWHLGFTAQLLLAASSAYDNGYATVVELALTTGDYYAIEDCSVSVLPLGTRL
jgi:hypothetical protein